MNMNDEGGLSAMGNRDGHPPHTYQQQQQLAAEIGDTLAAEVRSLRAQLDRHKKEFAQMEAKLAAAQEEKMGLSLESRELKDNQDRYKEENWHLEITCQDLQDQLDRKDTQLARITAECQRERRHVEAIENLKGQEDKDASMLDHARGRLLRELHALKKEKANLRKQLESEINNNHHARPGHEKSTATEGADRSVAEVMPTYINSRELETLRQSLAHAHRIITGLRSSFHKEKLERMQTAKLLAECQDVIEELSRPKLYRKRTSSSSNILGKKRSKRSMRTVKKRDSRETWYDTKDHQRNTELSKAPPLTLFNELMEQQHNTDIVGAAEPIDYHKETQATPIPSYETKATQTSNNRLRGSKANTCRPCIDSSVQCDIMALPKARKNQKYLGRIRRASLTIRQAMSIDNKPTPISIPTDAADPCRPSKLAEHAAKHRNNEDHYPSPSSPPLSSASPTHALPSSNVSLGTSSITGPSNSTMTTASNHSVLSIAPSATEPLLKNSYGYNRRHTFTFSIKGSLPTSHRQCTSADNPAVIREGMVTDPELLQAVTQAMVGDWMWKYTRRLTPTMTQKMYPRDRSDIRSSTVLHNRRNRRYFWIHPYTRTIFWSSSQPGGMHDKSKSKRALLKDVWSVPNFDRSSVIPFNLLIRTSDRDIMLRAEDLAQHYQWVSALCFLLGRPTTTASKNQASKLPSPTQQQRGAASSHRHSYSNNNDGNNSSSSCSIKNITNHHLANSSLILSMFLQGEDPEEDADDLVNIRQCCNGQHDVTTLARK